MKKTIMAVDDSASIRQMFSYTLKDKGYTVIIAEDGQDALEKISQTSIDMLITDLNMENIDGIELTKRVRAMSAYKTIPIILLTTESGEYKKKESKEAGATGWIEKPFQPEQLLATIEKLLGV